MTSVIMILGLIINVIFYLVLIQFIISLLVAFDIINVRQPVIANIYRGITALLDPLLNPIRNVLPPTGGIDFSPLVLLLGLTALQIVLANNF